MNTKPKGLGRGLGAIFEIENINVENKIGRDPLVFELELEVIHPNPNQPRTIFDEEMLSELAESIRNLGIIQPITVRKENDKKYTIISGERRWRAAQMAGLEKVPVYLREVDDRNILELALVENIQRQDLNALEIALSLDRLIIECEITQEALATRVGKKRSTVANYLRLLKLPAEVQLALREDLISMGHARALVGLESDRKKISLLKQIIKNHLSVRQVEEMIKMKEMKKDDKKSSETESDYPEIYTKLVENLEFVFNQNISIKKGNNGSGKIVISFSNDNEIEDIVSKLEKLKRK